MLHVHYYPNCRTARIVVLPWFFRWNLENDCDRKEQFDFLPAKDAFVWFSRHEINRPCFLKRRIRMLQEIFTRGHVTPRRKGITCTFESLHFFPEDRKTLFGNLYIMCYQSSPALQLVACKTCLVWQGL